MDTFTHLYEDGGVLFEMAKAGKGNIKGTAGVASLYFILSTVGPAQQGRMVGFISGGSLVANRGPVEWTCPVKRLLLAKTHLGFVKRVKEGGRGG